MLKCWKHSGFNVHRTRRNIIDSDATLILAPGLLTGGTRLTDRLAGKLGKPLLVVDATEVTVKEAVSTVHAFLHLHGIEVLNVAGPRASQWFGGIAFARAVIDGVLA